MSSFRRDRCLVIAEVARAHDGSLARGSCKPAPSWASTTTWTSRDGT
ncbi:MAG: hypothetical protein MI919_27565 [Holophagales bacterium]|nr:hypothetical protein [Holophagales bacterium]